MWISHSVSLIRRSSTWLQLPSLCLPLSPLFLSLSFYHISHLTLFFVCLSLWPKNSFTSSSLKTPFFSILNPCCSIFPRLHQQIISEPKVHACLSDVPYSPPVEQQGSSDHNYSTNILRKGHIPAAYLFCLCCILSVQIGNLEGLLNSMGMSGGLLATVIEQNHF